MPPMKPPSNRCAKHSNDKFSGRIVIGEGERDEAPMLFIGEEVGAGGPRIVACDHSRELPLQHKEEAKPSPL